MLALAPYKALASLVVIDGERRVYIDYPAQFKGPGDDLWRADDGGEIHAQVVSDSWYRSPI